MILEHNFACVCFPIPEGKEARKTGACDNDEDVGGDREPDSDPVGGCLLLHEDECRDDSSNAAKSDNESGSVCTLRLLTDADLAPANDKGNVRVDSTAAQKDTRVAPSDHGARQECEQRHAHDCQEGVDNDPN